jgi:tetrahydromethanopterin S-methyltransferase subunit G
MSAFDSLSFKQELTKVGFPADQAEVMAALTRDHVLGNAATKDDLLHVERRLDEKIDRVEERLKSEIKQLDQRMTIKLGSMLVVAVGLIITAQKLL